MCEMLMNCFWYATASSWVYMTFYSSIQLYIAGNFEGKNFCKLMKYKISHAPLIRGETFHEWFQIREISGFPAIR